MVYRLIVYAMSGFAASHPILLLRITENEHHWTDLSLGGRMLGHCLWEKFKRVGSKKHENATSAILYLEKMMPTCNFGGFASIHD